MKTFEIKVKNEKECDEGCCSLQAVECFYGQTEYECYIFPINEEYVQHLCTDKGKIYRCEMCKEKFYYDPKEDVLVEFETETPQSNGRIISKYDKRNGTGFDIKPI